MSKSSVPSVKRSIMAHLEQVLGGNTAQIWSKEQFGGSEDEKRAYPFVVFGQCEHRPWRSITFDGEHHRLNIDIYCGQGDIDQARCYAGNIIMALHSADFPLAGHALIEIKYEQVSYIKQAGDNAYIARLLFTVLTVCD